MVTRAKTLGEKAIAPSGHKPAQPFISVPRRV
jgi:hypothetical protein